MSMYLSLYVYLHISFSIYIYIYLYISVPAIFQPGILGIPFQTGESQVKKKVENSAQNVTQQFIKKHFKKLVNICMEV